MIRKKNKNSKNIFKYVIENNMSRELLIGSFVYFLLGEILILLLLSNKWSVSIGFIWGVLISTGMIIHMTIALEQAICMGEHAAYKHVRKTTAIRLLVVILALVLAGITRFGNIIAVLAGVMALKVSAYIQPFTHKVLVKKSTRKGR